MADGLRESFENVYRQHGLRDVFDVWAVSEEPAALLLKLDAEAENRA